MAETEDIESVVGTTRTIIKGGDNIYTELMNIPSVSRLWQIKQLGLANKCSNTVLRASQNRYSHTLTFATKIDMISQEHGLDRELAVSSAMLHDIASPPLSDSVAKGANMSDELYFEKVLETSDETKSFLDKHGISKRKITSIIRGEDSSPIGQLVNSKDSIDVDRWSYVTEDARLAGETPKIWTGEYEADPFKQMEIIDGRVVFKDVENVRQFLEARVSMFERIYKHEQLMAKEAFMEYLLTNLRKHVDLSPEKLLKMNDSEFEDVVHVYGGEIGKRILGLDGFKMYGQLKGEVEDIEKYVREKTDRPVIVKRYKQMSAATSAPILIDGEVKNYKEIEPAESRGLENRMGAWNFATVYGFDNDKKAKKVFDKAEEKFGPAYFDPHEGIMEIYRSVREPQQA